MSTGQTNQLRGLVRRDADLGVRTVDDEVSCRLVEAEHVDRIDHLAQALERRHRQVAHEHEVGGVLHRCERRLGEPCRRVHHDVGEVVAQEPQHSFDGGVAHLFALSGRVWRTQHVQLLATWRHEHLERRRRDPTLHLGEIADGVLGLQPEPALHVAELKVEIDECDLALGLRSERNGEVRGERRLARATLRGHDTDDFRPLGLVDRVRSEVVQASLRRLGDPVDHDADLIVRRLRGENVAHARPQGGLPQIRRRIGDEDDLDLGVLLVEGLRQSERRIDGDVGADEDHARATAGHVLGRSESVEVHHLGVVPRELAIRRPESPPGALLESQAARGEKHAAHRATPNGFS